MRRVGSSHVLRASPQSPTSAPATFDHARNASPKPEASQLQTAPHLTLHLPANMPFQRGNKFGGKRSRTSGVSVTRTPTPRVDDDEIEDDGATPPAHDDDEEEEEDGEEDDEPEITSIPRRRGTRGRPRGSRTRSARADRIDYGTPGALPDDGDEASESGTPFRRRRGRPEGSGRGRGRGGFRGRRRGQRPEAPTVVVDKDGQTLDVVDEEVQVDQDDDGDTKVDTKGNLQGGREYRVRTFKIIDKEDRLYMLSTEPARCCGFRDSYLFFTKHPKLYKVLLNEEQKKDLIERDILPNSYKGRNIAVVTARSVFREFGARIIVGGRNVVDDYQVANAKASGAVEGELADPNDRIPDGQDDYDRNRYVAWFGASEVYRQAAAAGGPSAQAKPGQIGKRRTNITVQNWQFMHAREASRFNMALTAVRNATHNGVYDSHTNMVFYPKTMQPTHVHWEQIPPPDQPADDKALLTQQQNGIHTNGTHDEDAMDIDTTTATLPEAESEPTIFPPVPAIVSRNFLVVDTHYAAPPALYPDAEDDILDELPEECRRALEEVKRQQKMEGKERYWGTEQQSAMRADLKIGFSGYPV